MTIPNQSVAPPEVAVCAADMTRICVFFCKFANWLKGSGSALLCLQVVVEVHHVPGICATLLALSSIDCCTAKDLAPKPDAPVQLSAGHPKSSLISHHSEMGRLLCKSGNKHHGPQSIPNLRVILFL